jgi:hypothetical protein
MSSIWCWRSTACHDTSRSDEDDGDMLVGGCGHGPPRYGTSDEEAVVEQRGAGVAPHREALSALHRAPLFHGS